MAVQDASRKDKKPGEAGGRGVKSPAKTIVQPPSLLGEKKPLRAPAEKPILPVVVPGSEPAKLPAPLDRTLRLASRFMRFAWDIGGVILMAIAVMTLVAFLFPNMAAGLLNWWAGFLLVWFGQGSLWLVFLAGMTGLWMLKRAAPAGRLEGNNPLQSIPGVQQNSSPPIAWGRVLALELSAFASMALLCLSQGASLERAQAGLDGGQVGWGLAELARLLLTPIGLTALPWRVVIFGAFFLVSLAYGLGLFQFLKRWSYNPPVRRADLERRVPDPDPVVSAGPLSGLAEDSAAPAEKKKRTLLPPQFRKNFRLEPKPEDKPASLAPRDERLPPLDLLSSEQMYRPDERNINLTAGLIEKTLAEFGIPAKVVGFRIGPTVTQFAVEPGFLEKEKPGSEEDVKRQKVRVAQISSLQRDLALALSASRLRIEAPVPGRPYVGIEVPNARSSIVRLRPLLESEIFYKVNSPLAIGLGRDVSGHPVVADLGRMPHLLIAGTTGSGKSVCIEAITACLVMNNTPEDLHLVMVDPKMVELVRFNGLPHLLGKVETDLERILAVLRWMVAEMDRRYKLLEISHSRNIDSYNRKARHRKGEGPLPRIVLMLDELADLMMSAPDQTEHNLVRLAQMARAVGIHLVVATQRPSTDVVTGLIKANFPARISFAVASSIDSRVILDTGGAESLLGRGDMLFLPPEASAPVRAQGVMVTDLEVEKVITFWQKSQPPADPPSAPWDHMLDQESVLGDRDNLIDQAIAVVRETKRANASMLQRRLRIGYPRAARLIEELEDLGMIGPSQGGGRERDVLVGKDEDEGEE